MIDRKDWHRSEYRAFLVAQRSLALTCGEQEAVRTVEAALRDLQPGRVLAR